MADPTNRRLPELDTTKGFLVVAMVAYHTLNYSTQYGLAFRYMAFLPPSFILITGLLITRGYGPRYERRPLEVSRRLWIRGLKVLLLFTGANCVIRLTLSPRQEGGLLRGRGAGELMSIFVVGDGYGVAFDVLLPVAYVLFLAPGLLQLNRVHRHLLPATALLCCVLLILLEHVGVSSGNLSLASAGLLGALAGRYTLEGRRSETGFTLLSGVSYVASSVWGNVHGQTYLVQMTSACAAVALLFFVSRSLPLPRACRDQAALLGQYSLVAYIVQIAALHAMTVAFGRPDPWSVGFWGYFVATLAVVQASAVALDLLRSRNHWFDRAYRAVLA